MGEIWLARDMNLERDVAIKCLNPNLTGVYSFIQRFKNEAQIQSSLTHPNIVGFHAFFQDDGNWFMVQEYARGITLRELISQAGPLPEGRALHIFSQIADALSYAHAKGIIHRDVKPSNIMVDVWNHDAVKVMDFGIARLMNDIHLTQTGETIGTIHYMSPEQVVATKEIDHRSDIYSTGVVLYEMLSGQLPFRASSSSNYHIQDAIVNQELPDPRELVPDISAGTVSLVYSLTMKDRERRPFSFSGVSHATDRGQTEAVPAPETPKKRPKLLWILAPVVILLAALAVFWLLREGSDARELERVKREYALVWVDGGEFEMGSDEGEGDEDPVHDVYVSGLNIANFEVPQYLWEDVMGNNPSRNKGAALPVENVTWLEALDFCNKLSRNEGLTPCYQIDGIRSTCDWQADGYRLPTEAEWEFAARGGNLSQGFVYSGSNDVREVSHAKSSDTGSTRPLGKKKANELGLHDMSGNVWEWCWDSYDAEYYASSAYENPRGPEPHHNRVLRGGAWNRDQERCKVHDRGKGYLDYSAENIGFRVVRS